MTGNAIEVRELTRRYTRKGKPDLCALDQVSLAVPQGEVHGLLGPNGAGKTTLCRILSTVLLPSSGSVTVLGRDVVRQAGEVKRLIGIVFGGDRGLYPRLTGRQNLELWASLYGLRRTARRDRVGALLERVGLSDRAEEKVQTYSRGMKQRLHLARGLVCAPGVLILDEPTVGMDPVAAHDFRKLVRQLRAGGHTVLMTTHDMAEAAALSDRVSFLDNGKLTLTASPEAVGELVSTHERLDARGLPAALREQVAALPGVVAVTAVTAVTAVEQDIIRIETETPEATRAVMLLLVEEGVTDIARTRPSLEEAYLHLVGRRRGMAVGQ
ncbi:MULTISPECIES: ABC transporter ATP-binding protein [unclassified Streptomyces]|uniref:ABC transporter ATP-binding protein n=1 Tax=unclassified Streptomyces TaxID=2593676 RepID=UPI002365A34A|nr:MULTISPECIES: ABC transporter ATP-binding protein [unclassified Streptomyces]MDF3147278.1 ABC transporter ATP-binding protein [Streptomyces sp. T21Q-yed]WDF38128.1 ABC transporter ATP-binding protein [Streptomyces sp. T12]